MTDTATKIHFQRETDRQSFRLFRYFVTLSIVAIVAIVSLVGFGLRGVLYRYVIAEAEKDAIRLTDALREIEMEAILHTDREGREHLGVHSPEVEALDRELRVFLSHFHIVKIKIFNSQRRIVYSTDRDIVGKIDADNAKLEKAMNGWVVSEFETEDRVWDLDDEERINVSIVETYVPVRGSKGQIVGSFETYKDVSDDFRSANVTLIRSVVVVAVTLIVVFAGLSVLMLNATRTIESHEKLLLANEARTRAIIDTAADGIITVTEQGEVRSFNTAAGQIFGYDPEQIIGKSFAELVQLPETMGRENFISRYCQEVKARGAAGHEMQGRRKDGAIFPMWLAVSEAQFADERLCTVMIRDLTQQKQAELRKREGDIKRAEEMKMVALLATGVAHELRNPLTSIKLFFQNNKEETLSLGMSVDDLNAVEHEILRMERSLQTFLDFARPSKPTVTTFDLSQEINRVMLLIEGRASQQQVTCLKFLPSNGAMVVKGDRDQIQQLLLNLAINSLDAMPDGGTIEFAAESPRDGQLELRISDTGPGISENVLSRLFEPFVTTKKEGVGLGLVISRRIAEEHGGSLTVTNQAEGGACFALILPLASPET